MRLSTLVTANAKAMVQIKIYDVCSLALIDSGVSKSYVLPTNVSELGHETGELSEPVVIRVDTNGVLSVHISVRNVECVVGCVSTWVDLSIAILPYEYLTV